MARPEMKSETSNLGRAIRQARGIDTRRTFAARVGCTEKTLFEWEKGKRAPSAMHHVRALRDIGVPLDLLLGDEAASVGASS